MHITIDRIGFTVDQCRGAPHPAPESLRRSKSSEIESQLKDTFPYLPTDVHLFDCIVDVTKEYAHELNELQTIKHNDAINKKRRRNSNEIHPESMQRTLDMTAGKWNRSEDNLANLIDEFNDEEVNMELNDSSKVRRKNMPH